MLRTTSLSINASGMRRRLSTWRKNSLISKIHQTDHASQTPERRQSVVNVSTVRGQSMPLLLDIDSRGGF